jgi:hypothetical protein
MRHARPGLTAICRLRSEDVFGWSDATETDDGVDPKEDLVGLFMTQSMMSFELPELDLDALAYQPIVD